MIVYHLDKWKYREVWPPEGTLHGEGRWNKKGQWIIYTSPAISLAKLEILANEGALPIKRICMSIEIDKSVPLYDMPLKFLPEDWFKKPYPASLSSLLKQHLLDAGRLLIRVPSAQSHSEFNYLINVRHPDFYKSIKLISVKPEPFDPRLKN